MDERTRLTIESVQRWLLRAGDNCYHQDSVESCFDKFFTLFVAFNVLYSHAAFRLQEPNPREDKKHATCTFALWVGHERILAKLNELPETTEDLATLRRLIHRNGPFFLFWKPGEIGEPQRDVSKNADLWRRLDSNQPIVRVRAILEYLYLVRCNIFHGSKAIEEPQKQILQPSIRCLERIVDLGGEKLREECRTYDVR